MDNKKMYVLTYDHGIMVLWGERNRVHNIMMEGISWIKKHPTFKMGLDYEAFIYDELSESDPALLAAIKETVRDYPDRLGIGSTTYGQPLSLFISGESNVRQLTYAIRANLEHFGKTPPVYCISEFALHNQTPQLLKLTGHTAAIMRTHVMNFGYQREFDSAWGNWIGKDGTAIPAVPSYVGEGEGYCNTTLDNWTLSRWPHWDEGDMSSYSLTDFEKKFRKYEPLLASRYDDLNQRYEDLIADVENHDNWQFILLEEIPEIYGQAKDELRTTDNDFHGKMPWGYCGNEIFNGCRAAEVNAALAERLNAMAVLLGGEPQQEKLEEAWKNVLIAQHHDVTICGLLDLARHYLPASQSASLAVKESSTAHLASRFATPDGDSILVVNTNSFPVTEWVEAEGRGCVYDGDAPLPTVTASEGRIRTLVSLGAMEAKRLTLRPYHGPVIPAEFLWDPKAGVLTTPLYRIRLTGKGIASIDDAVTGCRYVDNGEGKLFQGYVEDVNCTSSEENWKVTTSAHGALAVKTGTIGDIPFRFEMQLYRANPRIECSASFEIHGQHVGRTGVTKGLATDWNVNGSVHEEKLCFVMDTPLEQTRRMVRDIPFSISDWDGQVLKPKHFWYGDATVLVDTPVSPEESFQDVTYLQGLYWGALRDSHKGVALLNQGCMGIAVLGNEMRLPLIFANQYPCSTRMLDGTYSSRFAILPNTADMTDMDIHRQALAYSYPVECHNIPAGNGDLEKLILADFSASSDAVILTALYPENGALYARFCNYSDESATAVFAPSRGKVTAQTDLLGNTMSECNGQMELRPWEIKTLRIEL